MAVCLGDSVIQYRYILTVSQTQPALIKYLYLSSCISCWTSEISQKILNF